MPLFNEGNTKTWGPQKTILQIYNIKTNKNTKKLFTMSRYKNIVE